MAYYDALVAKWGTLTGTTDQKLAAVNALTVVGPNQDVEVSSVVGSLLLSGAYVSLAIFAASVPNGNTTHDLALASAKTLVALMTVPNVPIVQMSNPTIAATVKGMADAILAQETTSPSSTGFTQSVHDGLLALAVTQVPWWQSASYPRPFDLGDISAAGLS